MKLMNCVPGAQPCIAAHRPNYMRLALTAPLIAGLLCASGAQAQVAGTLPSPVPQFDVLGFIQAATLDPTLCPTVTDPALWGGTVTVNGIKMIVPCNTILQMPANTLSWGMMFPSTAPGGTVIIAPPASTPVPPGNVAINGQPTGQAVGQIGLALTDTTTPATPTVGAPFPSFEIHVSGNIVKNTTVGSPAFGTLQYIIGLIAPVSQQGLNSGQGTITCLDYANSYIFVGGDTTQPASPTCSLPSGAPNGARLQLNDPIGRWGNIHSPDPRFSGDTNNSTVSAQTGFPMCLPRVDPAVALDPQCPIGNRPLNGDVRFPQDAYRLAGAPLQTFTMPPPPAPAFGIPAVVCAAGDIFCVPANAVPPAAPVYPDARFQAPFMVGDQVTYQGSIAKDALGQTYISVHTFNDNLGIFTAPGTQPAYVGVEVILLGNAGTPVPGTNLAQEATTRIFDVGFTTDPSTMIDVNAVDRDPCTGVETLRLLGTVDPRAQVLKGRWRFHVLGGQFMPATRDMRMVIHGEAPTFASAPFNPAQAAQAVGVANGLGSGQYQLPNFAFIFPENLVLGEPLVPNNFQDIPFLAQGSGPHAADASDIGITTIVGPLIPWPGDVAPIAPVCSPGLSAPPVVNAGLDFVLGAGLANELLMGNVSQSPNALAAGAAPTTITWTQTLGPDALLTQPAPLAQDPVMPRATFTSPPLAVGQAPIMLQFALTVTDANGTTTSLVNAKVIPVPTDGFAVANAIWKAPKLPNPRVAAGLPHAPPVVNKGGLLSVTAADTVTDATITMQIVGYGAMSISTILALPNYMFKTFGVEAPFPCPENPFLGIPVRSVPACAATVSVVIRTSGGSEITVPLTLRP